MFTSCSFDENKNEINYYRGKDCTEKLCKKLKEHAIKIINYDKKEMIPLTKEEYKSYKTQETCHICEKKFCVDKDDEDYINRKKVKDHCHYTGKFRGAAHSKCNLNYKVPKDIPIIIHNASYDTHFIINQLAEEFKGELDCIDCIEENMEKLITFSVAIKKECGGGKTITHKLRFIDSLIFMSTSLSDLVDNMSGNFNSIDYKSCTENNRCEECKKLIEGLIKKFSSVYQFCNNDLNKFILLLWKGVYPYEYKDSWEKFDETTLPPKEAFYSNLNLEDISDEDYAHAQKVWDAFEIKNLGEYHDLYVQSDTLLLADVFENFRNMCLEIYGLDPLYFLSAPGLAWQACLKKTEVKLELLTDYNIILMVEKGIRGGICQVVHRYAKANNKYIKIMIKALSHHI